MLRKIIDCKSLEISQENFYGGVFSGNVTSLLCSDCNFAIKRSHHRFVLEYVPKPSSLKKNILQKKSIVDLRHSKVATPQYTTLNLIKKAELMYDLPEEAVKDIFIGKPLWLRLFFTKVAGLEFIPAISIKQTPSQSFSYMSSARQLSLNNREVFWETSLQNMF